MKRITRLTKTEVALEVGDRFCLLFLYPLLFLARVLHAVNAGLTVAFYDSAPSGKCGTMTYMCRAITEVVSLPNKDGFIDCSIQ